MAKLDSIGLVVRRCRQYSAGKSKNAVSASQSFSSFASAFGHLASNSVRKRSSAQPERQSSQQLRFEYGTSTAYGLTAPCTPSPGSGTSAVAVSAPLSGLKSITTYHFRISAANESGSSLGQDQTLQTG